MIASKPDLRRRAVLPLIAAVALGLSACGDSKSGSGDTDPASVVPETASAYVAVSVHPEGDAGKNAAAASQSLFGTTSPGQLLLDTLAGRAKALDGLSYEEDVAPWLGDQVALAAVPVEEGKSAPLLVAATRDEDKARDALDKSGALSRPASASGVDYVRTPDGSLAAAVTDGAAIVGSDAAVQLVARGNQERGRPDRASALPQRDRRASGRRHRDGLRRSGLFREGPVRRSRRRHDRRPARERC